ncbi:MAG: hypothetical protein AAF252_12930 [Pseudomonadota bacterium]
MEEIQITLDGAELSEGEQQDRVRQLTREIEARTDAKTSLAREQGTGGTKGDPLTIGSFLMAFMSSGAAEAAFHVIKSWIERDKIGSATFKTADGTEVTINNANIEQIETIMSAVKGD